MLKTIKPVPFIKLKINIMLSRRKQIATIIKQVPFQFSYAQFILLRDKIDVPDITLYNDSFFKLRSRDSFANTILIDENNFNDLIRVRQSYLNMSFSSGFHEIVIFCCSDKKAKEIYLHCQQDQQIAINQPQQPQYISVKQIQPNMLIHFLKIEKIKNRIKLKVKCSEQIKQYLMDYLNANRGKQME